MRNGCRHRSCHLIALLWITAILSGCGTAPTTQPSTAPAIANPAVSDAAIPGPQDARRTVQQFFQLQIYQLAVPVGAISGNEVFWKPFDETFLGFDTHRILYKNGLRVGLAPVREMQAIQNQLDGAERKDYQLVGTQAKSVEMELVSNVDAETLFGFDALGRSEGHDFSNVDNLFMLGFYQVPRQPDHIHLDITPAVREHSQKYKMENDEPRLVRERSLYEIGVHLEMGINDALVIAPSTVGLNTSTSVGRIFMMEEKPAARVEKVLVIIPRIQRGVQEVKPIGGMSR